MPPRKKNTDNHLVADWLIEHRWRNALSNDTKTMMPAFVENAVMSAVYIVAGTSKTSGLTNVSPKLVFKVLMLSNITTESVKVCEVGYEMSDRQAQRLAQTARFALDGIRHRIQEYEYNLTALEIENIEMERQFIKDYYQKNESILYSPPVKSLPEKIAKLRLDGRLIEYAEAVRDYRLL